MDRPTKPSGRHAVRLRWDEIITRLSYRFNFLAIRATTNDSEGSASVALIVAPALAARATATTRMRKILPIQIAPSPIHQGLIPTALIGDLCPWPCSNGGHLFDIVDEGVPGGAASLNDLLIRVPDDVTEIVGTQI